jgi:hypothetical protein
MEDIWIPAAFGFATAVVVPRQATVALASLVWALYTAAVALGVWGNGLGESWAAAAALLTIVTALGAIGGLVVGRGIRLRRADRARTRSTAV